MQIQAVIFDFGGVLCFHPTERKVVELALLCGVTLPEFQRAFWGHRIPYDRGDWSAEEFWRAFGKSTGRTFTDAQILEFVHHDADFWSRLDPRAMDWARRVRGSGIRTALLSNLPAELGAQLYARGGFLREFDHHTFSYEVRAVKPEPEIYRHCLRGLGVEPSRALFLDDRIENVRGAAALGILSVLYEGPESLTRLSVGYQLPAFPDSEA